LASRKAGSNIVDFGDIAIAIYRKLSVANTHSRSVIGNKRIGNVISVAPFGYVVLSATTANAANAGNGGPGGQAVRVGRQEFVDPRTAASDFNLAVDFESRAGSGGANSNIAIAFPNPARQNYVASKSWAVA
jgi:hypothetical protein